jgi:hypothetical protein
MASLRNVKAWREIRQNMETNNAIMKDLVDPHCVSLIIEQPLIRDSPESAITNFFRFILEAN